VKLPAPRRKAKVRRGQSHPERGLTPIVTAVFNIASGLTLVSIVLAIDLNEGR
jgi:hypothetical protein